MKVKEYFVRCFTIPCGRRIEKKFFFLFASNSAIIGIIDDRDGPVAPTATVNATRKPRSVGGSFICDFADGNRLCHGCRVQRGSRMKDQAKSKGRLEGSSTPLLKRPASSKAGPGKKPSVEAEQRAGSLLTSILESTTDGILVIDNRGKVILFNKKFLSLWRIPESLAAKRDDHLLLEYVLSQLKDPEGFIAKVEQLYSRPEAESFDVLEFIDGRVFERFSQPQRLGNNIAGRVWSFRDVTDRRQAEEKQRLSRETAERLAKEMAIIAEIGRLIRSTLDIREVYERLAAEADKLIPFDRLSLNVRNPHDDTIEIAYVSGSDVPSRGPGDAVPRRGTMTEEVLHSRTGLLVQPESKIGRAHV